MNEEPKYCKYCGRELVRKTISDGYDGGTGEPRTILVAECPGAGWIGKWVSMNLHSKVIYNEYSFRGEKQHVWVWLTK